MQHAFHPHRHQVLVLGEDRRHAVPGRMRGIRGDPVHAIGSKKIDVVLPLLRIEQIRLPVQELFYRVLDIVLLHRPFPMYCAHAFIWLRIGASDVPMFGLVSTRPGFSESRPKWRPNVTQSPPWELSPCWHL